MIADWASGRATLIGAILKDTATGKIVGHVQQTNVLQNLITNAGSSFGDLASKGFSPLEIINVVQNEQLKRKLDLIREGMMILQNLQLGTLAVSGLGLGVSIVGFAVLAKRLRTIETRLDRISQQLVSVTSDRREDELRAVLADIGANVSAVEGLSSWTEPRRVAEQLQSDLNKYAHRLETIFVRETDFSGRKSLPIEHLDRLWAIASALHLCHEAAIQALFVANEIPVARIYALAASKRSLELLQSVSPDGTSRLISRGAEDWPQQIELRKRAKSLADSLFTGMKGTALSLISQASLSETLVEQKADGAALVAAIKDEKNDALLFLPS
ncbi:MAG: hypothetical protein WAT77_13035 [Paracoccaceae bacterium]